MHFVTPDGITLQARDPIVQAAMLELGEAWPRAIPFEELLNRARARPDFRSLGDFGSLSGTGRTGSETYPTEAEVLARSFLQFFVQASTSLVEFWLDQPSFTNRVSERPTASPLARLQAAGKERVTTLRHETAHLGDFERHVLRLLDGTRTRADLVSDLAQLALDGELSVEKDGQPIRAAPQLREVIGQALDSQLDALAKHALFAR